MRKSIAPIILIVSVVALSACSKEAKKEQANPTVKSSKTAAVAPKAKSAESNKPEVVTPKSTATTQASPKAKLKAYGTLAKSLLDAIQSGKDAKDIGAMAEKLVSLGVEIAPAFSKKHADCGPYLNALLAVSSTLASLSLDAIERDYHADGKLPKSPAEKCHHAKDLIVHPATVIVLSKQGLADKIQRDKATGEIAEVLAHLSDVEKNL